MGTYIKNSCGGECCPTLLCSAFLVKVKRKSATLNLVGFSPFTCPNTPAPAPNTPITRYLQYRVNCSSAQVGCVTPIQKSTTTTYTIDPFTGLQCVSGDVSVGCGCVNGSNESFTCSPTSQTTNCGPLDPPPEYEGCTDISAGGDKTVSISLSQPYTINNVESNVDSIMAGNPLDDVMKFPAWDSDAQIIAGTGGNTAVSWDAVSPCSILSTLFYKSDYSVTKSELLLEFLGTTTVKVYFTPQEGGPKTLESETEYDAGESVTISAPSSIGVRTLELTFAGSPSSSNFPSIVTPVTTGQRVSKVRNADAPFAGFIAPDCKRYAVLTTVSSYSYSASGSSEFRHVYPYYNDWEGITYDLNANENFTSTITESIDGQTAVYGGSGSSVTNVMFRTDQNHISNSVGTTTKALAADGTLTTITTTVDTFQGETTTYGPFTTEEPYNVPTSTALCDRTTTTTSTAPTYEGGPPVTTTTTTTEQRSISGSSISSTVGIETSVSWNRIQYDDTETGAFSYSTNYSFNMTWSGDMADTLTPENSTTTTWESNGGLCAYKTESADGNDAESQSLTANFNVSVTVPTVSEPTSPTNYKTFIHWFVVTNDSSNPNCPTRSVMAENRTKFNYVRGPFSLTESATLPNDLHVTRCITNMAASTEVQL